MQPTPGPDLANKPDPRSSTPGTRSNPEPMPGPARSRRRCWSGPYTTRTTAQNHTRARGRKPLQCAGGAPTALRNALVPHVRRSSSPGACGARFGAPSVCHVSACQAAAWGSFCFTVHGPRWSGKTWGVGRLPSAIEFPLGLRQLPLVGGLGQGEHL